MFNNVNSRHPNDSVIFNIAYAAIHGDSIPSTSHTCMLAGIVADSLQAVDDDAASIFSGNVSVIDVLGNDHLGQCSKSTILVEILVPPKSGAMVIIEQDKTLRYVSSPAFSGNDSLTYTIQCNSTISTAKVRIQVHSLRPVAITDHLYLFTCQSKQTDVLANDANAASGAVTMLKDGTRGTATFSGGIMTYVNNKSASTCSTHGGKTDTVRYEICTPNGCARANVIVHILRIPRTVLIDSCSTSPYLLADPQYKNATYQWYKSSDGSTGWTSIPGATNARLSVTEEAWYKLEVTYNGDAIETAPVHFVIRTKHRLSSGSYWYDTTIH